MVKSATMIKNTIIKSTTTIKNTKSTTLIKSIAIIYYPQI